MTIKEFAKNQGITTQAVYARIKAAGVELSSIKKEKSPELTTEGIEILNSIFEKGEGASAAKVSEYKAIVARLQAQLEKMEKELEEARNDAEKEKEGADGWKAQSDYWREIAEKAQETALNAQEIASKLHDSLQDAQRTAQQAQALNLASIQALKAAPQAPKIKWWQRLLGKREAGEDREEKSEQETQGGGKA